MRIDVHMMHIVMHISEMHQMRILKESLRRFRDAFRICYITRPVDSCLLMLIKKFFKANMIWLQIIGTYRASDPLHYVANIHCIPYKYTLIPDGKDSQFCACEFLFVCLPQLIALQFESNPDQAKKNMSNSCLVIEQMVGSVRR